MEPIDKEDMFSAVAVGCSAGGVAAMRRILSELPINFPIPVLVAQHRASTSDDLLPVVLGYSTDLTVKSAEEGEMPKSGVVYLAPPGRHLHIGSSGQLHVSLTERIRHVRPSADLLFETAAAFYESKLLAVVLTGLGNDGTRGIRAARKAGGFAIAQDATTSEHYDMPLSAAEVGRADMVLPLFRIAFALTALVMGREAAVACHPDPGPVGRELRTLHQKRHRTQLG